MGLDIVEIFLAVEDHFGIAINDAAATACVTLGDLHKVVVQSLIEKGRAPSPALDRDVLRELIEIVAPIIGDDPTSMGLASRLERFSFACSGAFVVAWVFNPCSTG